VADAARDAKHKARIARGETRRRWVIVDMTSPLVNPVVVKGLV
jgi:hypothetical protein